MTDFRISIEDQSLLDGITWARNQYNNGLPPDNMLMAEDNDYISFIVVTAATSWATQSGKSALAVADADGKVTEAIKDAEAGDVTKLAALLAEYSDNSAVKKL